MPTDSFLFQSPIQPLSGKFSPPKSAQSDRSTAHAQNRIEAVLVLCLLVAVALPLGGNSALVWMTMSAVTSGTIVLLGALNRLDIFSPKGDWARLIWLPVALCGHALLQVGLGWFGPSPPGSIAPMDSFVAVLRLAGLALFFLLATQAAKLARTRLHLLDGVLVMATAFAAWALVTGIEAEQDRITGLVGTFANRNNFATFLGMAMMVAVARFVEPNVRKRASMANRLRHMVLLACLLVLAIALVATQSRMGLVSALIGSAVVLSLQSKRHMKFGALGALAVIGLAIFAAGGGLMQRLPLLPADWDLRAGFYAQILGLIAERPLAGFGADSFALAFETGHAPGVSAAFMWDRAHSTYLELWVENGVIVGSLPILAGLWAVVLLHRRCGTERLADRRAAKAALGALVLGATHAIFDFGLEILANQLLLITLLACGLSARATPERIDPKRRLNDDQ